MARRYGGRRRRRRFEEPKRRDNETSEKEEGIELEGTVTENLPNAQFRVKLDEVDEEVLAYLSGKMRKHWIRILRGDRVRVIISPYDTEKARIIYRYRA